MRTVLSVTAALAMSANAFGIIVQGTELAPYTAVTNQLGMSHGVTFSSLNYPAVTFTELMPTVWGIQGCEPFSPPANGGWYNAPIFVTFVDPSDGVTPAVVNGTITARWGDGGGDFDAVDMRAYDLANTLVTAQTFTGTTFTIISISGVGIHRVEFWANTNVGAGTSDTGFDWIDYPTPQIPAPGALALLGLAGVVLRRRR